MCFCISLLCVCPAGYLHMNSWAGESKKIQESLLPWLYWSWCGSQGTQPCRSWNWFCSEQQSITYCFPTVWDFYRALTGFNLTGCCRALFLLVKWLLYLLFCSFSTFTYWLEIIFIVRVGRAEIPCSFLVPFEESLLFQLIHLSCNTQ